MTLGSSLTIPERQSLKQKYLLPWCQTNHPCSLIPFLAQCLGEKPGLGSNAQIDWHLGNQYFTYMHVMVLQTYDNTSIDSNCSLTTCAQLSGLVLHFATSLNNSASVLMASLWPFWEVTRHKLHYSIVYSQEIIRECSLVLSWTQVGF